MVSTSKVSVRIHTEQGLYFREQLSANTFISMVSIPGGTFQMGSPEGELERRTSESPQHAVTVQPFYMGMYPVTQAQWRVVASWERINRDLEAAPSTFEGDSLPVETISWEEAVEYCDRLTQRTGRTYRLPTEAEWEYACRAGTTTPFHFGETITTDLANYRGTDLNSKGSYGVGPIGDYREKTTPVGSFEVANAFGLYDMHGNVFEWCADHWHENYEGAPTDGSAWIEDDEASTRVLRGGSWADDPRVCRSAYRDVINLDYRYNDVGFRVVCDTPRTL